MRIAPNGAMTGEVIFMKTIHLSAQLLSRYAQQLRTEEKSGVTIEKYLRDVRQFGCWLNRQEITKERVIDYKQKLLQSGYALRSVNSMLASVNHFLRFCDLPNCRVRLCRLQREIYQPAERELTKAEYLRLLKAAKNDRRLWLLLQTICATGIRVSELRYFTVCAVYAGEVTVTCKNKSRKILIPSKLRKMLLRFARERQLDDVIFCTRTGKPMNRGNIWASMKRLCARANVNPGKVFPHNLRKLFARTFYTLEKDIAKLADILGHSSINTTRIYLVTTGVEHRRQIEQLNLLDAAMT